MADGFTDLEEKIMAVLVRERKTAMQTIADAHEIAGFLDLQVSELQKILYRARWHVSTDNFCDCHARHGEPHKSENCLLLVLAAAVEKSPKCCHPFEPDKKVHSEFCRNYTEKQKDTPGPLDDDSVEQIAKD